MGVEIKTVPLVNIGGNLPCLKPKPDENPVEENHPAIEVMTDFSTVIPVTIEPYFSLEAALDRMKTMAVRLLLVTDKLDHISGIITSYDIQSEKPLKYSEETGIAHGDINVDMLMTPITETPAVDFEYVKQSLVRHVINTMKELNRPHMLVIEMTEKGHQQIRGLFSTSNISKILGRKIFVPLKASHSFVELKQSIS
jgi:CBS domain-containing protein